MDRIDRREKLNQIREDIKLLNPRDKILASILSNMEEILREDEYYFQTLVEED